MKKFISYKESIQKLEDMNLKPKGVERVFISEALDRVLAEDIIALENSPKFPTSAMDGYAIKHEDLKLGKIKIIDKNPAGSVVESVVTNGVTIKTFTGSLMPDGADTLIPIENVSVENDEIVINEEVVCGFSVRPVGENYKENEVLIHKGDKISFAEIGVLASLNISQVTVYKKPTVAVCSTGSEILDIGDVQTNDAQIRSSNHLTIAAIAKKHNADVLQLGVVSDDYEEISTKLKDALAISDIVVTTGGVSVGDYDFVKDIIGKELGADVVFKGVTIKPGQHIMVAQNGNKAVVGLPGFAFSSTVTFLLYVVPLIKQLSGEKDTHSFLSVKATLKEDFKKKTKKTEFIICNVSQEDNKFFVDFDGKKGGSSAILTNMLGINTALMTIDATETDKLAGDEVDVLLIN